MLGERRAADLARQAGIDRRFEDDDGAGAQHAARSAAQALSSGVRSGRRSASIGVGTVTMKKLTSPRSAVLLVRRREEARSSSALTSPVTSLPPRSPASRRCEMSKPIDRLEFLGQGQGNGKADIAQADDRKSPFHLE